MSKLDPCAVLAPVACATVGGSTPQAAGPAALLESDAALMDAALAEAGLALAEREVPVGCVLAVPLPFPTGAPPRYRVLATARNRTNASFDPTRHAEMVALDAVGGGLSLPALREALRGATLCVTVEPCVMCAAALQRAGVARIVFGAANPKFGGVASVLPAQGAPGAAGAAVEGGLRAAEAVALLKQFYNRPNARTTAGF